MTIEVSATQDSQFGTNSYLVVDQETKDAAIIDANLEPQQMVDLARSREARVRAILLTHTDLDHIAGLPTLLGAFPVPVAIHEAELDHLARGTPLRGSLFPVELPPVRDPEKLVEGAPYRAGSLSFEVLHTPGHSPGGVSLKIGDVVFTGDALFAGSIGRTDLLGGDLETLLDSIRTRLLSLPDALTVLSGHGPQTTIGRERRGNPFLTEAR